MDLGHETLDLGRVSMDAAAPTAVQVAVQGGGDGEQEGSALGERVHWSRSCSWKKGDHAGRGRERDRGEWKTSRWATTSVRSVRVGR